MKLSIIIPVYNCEKYLAACLDSCLNQAPYVIGEDYEIVCINDGSSDASLSILESYKQNGLKIITQQRGGVSKARNRGLSESEGDYVWYVDSDDLIVPNILESAFNYIIEHHSLGIYFKFQTIGKDYVLPANYTAPELIPISPKDRILSNVVYSIIVNRQYLIDNRICFNEDMKYGEDTLWRFYISVFSDNFLPLGSELYLYRVVPTSAMHQKSKEKRAEWVKSMWIMLDAYCKLNEDGNRLSNQNLTRQLKQRIEWSTANILFGGMFISEQEALENLNTLKKRKLYPYPILLSRFLETKSKVDLLCLPFPFEIYYRLLLKVKNCYLFQKGNSGA